MLRATANILLSLVILVSSTGVSVNMHFCHDHLIHVALVKPAEKCCPDEGILDNCCENNLSQTNTHCRDESLSINTSEDYLASIATFHFNLDFSFDLPWATGELHETLAQAQVQPALITGQNKPPPGEEVYLPSIQAFRL